MPTNETDDSQLREIRETHEYFVDRWQDIYDEGGTDMRYLSGDPWDPKEKADRKDKLPALSFDELNQYLNQLINDVRQNKRAIKVIPKGTGSTDKSAELRGDLLRQIEYESRAQASYETAFEGGSSRGYGFAGWRKKYVSERSFDQELQIRRFPNPDAVMLDYDAKEWDCSDGMAAFVLDLIPEKQFKMRYPKAQITDFSDSVRASAPDWFKNTSVQVAEYWKVNLKPRKLLLVNVDKIGYMAIFEDELRGSSHEGKIIGEPKKERIVEQREVCQYLTNGVEILEENDWDGQYIPIAPCWGREMWLNEGTGSKRIFMSLVRLARDPYMAYCYLRTNEIIEARMTPKAPFIGYEGQFVRPKEWESAATTPIAFLQAKAKTDATGDQILPLPGRPQFQPNFQAYEVACEAMRRAIQSAMGKYNVSVGKNDSSVHSGVQQNALDQQSDQGSFHFIDNYERFLECMGRIGDNLLDTVYDTARDVGTRKMDDSHHVMRLNDPDYVNPKSGKKEHLTLNAGDHGVAIVTGPYFPTQKEQAESFVEKMLTNIEALPIDPDRKAQIVALLIKLQDLGPLGDQMAEIVYPAQGDPQQALAKAQQNSQAQGQLIQELNAELQKLKLERAGKVIQGETQKQLQQMQNDIKVLTALITAKNQQQDQERQMFLEFWKENHGAAKDLTLQANQHQHEKDLAAQNADAAAQAAQQQEPEPATA